MGAKFSAFSIWFFLLYHILEGFFWSFCCCFALCFVFNHPQRRKESLTRHLEAAGAAPAEQVQPQLQVLGRTLPA